MHRLRQALAALAILALGTSLAGTAFATDAGADGVDCATEPLVNLAGVEDGVAAGVTWTGGEGKSSPSVPALDATQIPSPAEFAGSLALTFTTDDPVGACVALSEPPPITRNPAATLIAGLDRTVPTTAPQVRLAGVVGGNGTRGTRTAVTGRSAPRPRRPSSATRRARPGTPRGARRLRAPPTIRPDPAGEAGADQ